MNIGIPKESRIVGVGRTGTTTDVGNNTAINMATEPRVAISPTAVKKLVKKNIQVFVERGAGFDAQFSDDDLAKEGAQIVDRSTALSQEVIFKIHPPSNEEILGMKPKAILLSLLEPYANSSGIEALAKAQISAFALELIPRTSRAQSMDVLSSQANIAGYRAVLEATMHYKRFFPMMMTSAGLAKQARALILGVGVAGLQAIATAKRLGASVEAFDVRPEVKEQILSLGAKFLDLGVGASGEGGYARELTVDEKKQQEQALTEKIKKFDIVVTTANVPGRKAPRLISEEAVLGMRAGSVVIDMAAPSGGNCAFTVADQVVEKNGVLIVGHTNYPAMVASDASLFFSQNLVSFSDLFYDAKEKAIKLNLEDDILNASLVTHQGARREPQRDLGRATGKTLAENSAENSAQNSAENSAENSKGST